MKNAGSRAPSVDRKLPAVSLQIGCHCLQ